MDWSKEFIRTMEGLAGRYTEYQIFSDWAEMAAISYRNGCHIIHDPLWDHWEKKYLDVAGRYSREELHGHAYMTACIAQALEEEMEDVLGRIFMEAGLGNRGTGQFFTPFPVSLALARLAMPPESIPEEGPIRMMEPACGAGGMVIAACKILREMGIDYQRRLEVIAQDLDWRGVYMTYIQLSLLGCRAIVVQGNTLEDPYHIGYDRKRSMATPAKMGLFI